MSSIEDVDSSYSNKDFFGGLSKMACAMITQAVKDFMREPDSEIDQTPEDLKKIRTKNSSINKYKKSAGDWLVGDVKGEFSLEDCCSLINSRLKLDGAIGAFSGGISVKDITKLVDKYNDTNEINEELLLLSKITYLCEKDQKPKKTNEAPYSINISSNHSATESSYDHQQDVIESEG